MGAIKAKPNIMEINPYIGGEAKIEGINKLVRLASNENALGTSQLAIKACKENLSEIYRYPNGGADKLREALAKKYGLNLANIVCGAGSEELISLIIKAYAGVGDEVLYSYYGFLMYPISAKAVGATPVTAAEHNLTTSVDEILGKVNSKTKLIFIANPNNPTGSFIAKPEIKRLIDNIPEDILLIIDEAYAEFALAEKGYNSTIDMVDDYNNLCVLRTFSKIYGLAGLRVGWGYFPAHVTDVLHRVRGPFNVNSMAQIAAMAALSDDEFIEKSIAHNKKWLQYLVNELKDMGVKTCPSAGNFLLARFGKNAEEIRLKLRKNGIFIRQMGAYSLPEYLRITVGLEDENKALCSFLAKIIKP